MRARVLALAVAAAGLAARAMADDPFLALDQELGRQAEESLARLTAPRVLPAVPERATPAAAVSLESILDGAGVPARLLGVVRVESGFRPWALSPKGARGLWQFMPETARRFGLRVDAQRDERIEPERATRAASQYLRFLHGLFGDWKLALAAYNAGEGRVQRAIGRGRTRDFYELSRRGLLPEETRRYVPAVLAGVAPAAR
ncbi:MAG TPA: lytic transglycosylase domain-containing protein [Bryobacterales bacterium]|nr:lytic transglycosylase domain-containing protein [Bryobacterales bacterium]